MPTATGTPPLSAELASGTAGRLASALAVPGRPEHVQAVRAFTALVLRVHSREDEDGTAGLLVSELVANALIHSDSGRPGGLVTVAVIITAGETRVEVTDDGGAGDPGPPGTRADDPDAEHGRGLHLVQQLSAKWGHFRRGHRLTTWFELPVEQPS